MTLKIYAIYDKKVLFFSQPFFLRNKADALRGLDELVDDVKTKIHKYPSDYQIFEIGEWDEITGLIASYEKPLFLEEAASFIKKECKNDNQI